MSTVLLFCGALFFGLFLHPFTTYPLSLWLARRMGARPRSARMGKAPPPARPRFSILTCAHNEERTARAMAENRLAVAAPRRAEFSSTTIARPTGRWRSLRPTSPGLRFSAPTSATARPTA